MILTIAAARGAILVAAGLSLAATATGADAVSLSVRKACISDYMAYCSKHMVGSPALRQCMSNAGPRLSKGCVAALVSSGEVSASEVSRRAAMR